jgi:GDP-L-fucose synthase
LYVEDAAEGILAAVEGYDEADPVNLGTGREITIRQLVDLVADLTGFKGRYLGTHQSQMGSLAGALTPQKRNQNLALKQEPIKPQASKKL